MAEFQNAFDSIKSGIKDLAELNVKTFTGDVSVSASGLKDLDMDKLFANVGANAQIDVVGITDMKIDGDINQFITSKEVPAGTLTAHSRAVETGQRTRQAMFELFVDRTKKLIEKLT